MEFHFFNMSTLRMNASLCEQPRNPWCGDWTVVNLLQQHIVRFSIKDIVLITLLASIFLLGTVGNSVVVYWFGFTVRRKLAGSVFVTALALTDLVTSVFVPIDLIHTIVSRLLDPFDPQWHLGRVACYIKTCWNPVFLFASSWLLVVISFVRWR